MQPPTDERTARVADALRVLGEYFDSVQIFATYTEGGETNAAIAGVGNAFATQALVASWIGSQGNLLEPADDDEEEEDPIHG